MPELPEVETIRSGIAPLILGKTVVRVHIRERRLRWPVTPGLEKKLCGETVSGVTRRGKYLLVGFSGGGTLMIHLGMSGRLRAVPKSLRAGKHDHIDIDFDDGTRLRFTDPRRFGACLWTDGDPLAHPLLAGLGPEPLGDAFDGDTLFRAAQRKKLAVKAFVMDSHVVVGVGNIYANEALFVAGLHPLRPVSSLDRAGCEALACAIRDVLGRAIRAGGTTLRDFISATGDPGYFQQELFVYGRTGEPCLRCGSVIQLARTGQRSTFFCAECQPAWPQKKAGSRKKKKTGVAA